MKNKHSAFLSIIVFIIAVIPMGLNAQTSAGLTADAIITRMENSISPETVMAKGRMITTDSFGSKTSSFISWAQGTNRSLIEFTSVEEQGQKILRTDDDLYVYYPDAQRTIRMQGSALRDSVMGSDYSYEDMTTGDRGILDDYTAELLGSGTVEGRDCYHIRLTARVKDLPYYMKELWIDKENFAYRQQHMFALSGRLVKEMVVKEIRVIGGFHIPVVSVTSDKMKRNSSTTMYIDEMEVNISLGRNFFSLRELSR